ENRAYDCQPVGRQPLVPDVAQVPTASAPRSTSNQAFCALEEQNAQCLAAMNASLANLLDQEAEAVAQQRGGHLCSQSGSTALSSELLELSATHQRNAAAANSLEAFLRLVEAEAGADNLELRRKELDLMLADITVLLEQGLLTPISKAEVEAQRLELWHRQVDLQATIQKLNGQLEELLGVEIADEARFWPVASLLVTAETPDRTAAVQLALTHRADLAAIRLAASTSGAESTAAARTILQLTGAGLGMAPSTPCCLSLLLLAHGGNCEDAVREQQLDQLRSDRERSIRQETRLAAALVETRLEQIGMTKRRLEFARQHLKASEERQAAAANAPLAVRKARLDTFAIEQDLLHDVIEWKLAIVKLKEAQGLLAVECGYDNASHVSYCCP
ncbi:MAG TPA: hypothetical protein VL096_17880, partial [Pirellulaceae bacterium]|nr:hypothetical protein [Pirellulaceae bacterium]